MDFELALNQILYELKINDIEYGLVGGLALGILGIDRATSDIDFLVQNSDKDLVRKIMLELKYESIFHSINFSLFQSPLKALGEIDFIHPDTNTISEILSRKVNYSINNIFSLSDEEISILREKKKIRSTIKIPINEVLLFLKSYNEMINHRQKKIVPKSDGEWLI